MNKRIFFILLPVFLLLLNTSKGIDIKSFSKKAASSFASPSSAHTSTPPSSDLKNGGGKVNRNAIRIKAKNGFFELNIPEAWSFTTKIAYPAGLVFGLYNIYAADAHPAINKLRGPPSLA